jgi:hypothetical protein
LAAEIYATAFGFDEKSDAPTDISGSQLLALRGNRRQDYQGSWYELTENFPKFLDAAPETAAQALNRAMEGYVERERSSNRTTEQRTVEFNYRDRTASYTADNSYIWLQTALGSRQDAPQLLLKLAAKLQNDAAPPKITSYASSRR